MIHKYLQEHFHDDVRRSFLHLHLSKEVHPNEVLQKKMEDFKVIDRAKCTLVGVLKMNEHQAHRYIQKQAMDQRVKPRIIADSILKTYEF